MARYIDADALYKETEKKIAEANSYRMAVVDGEFLDLINDAETADVVPKSEVEKLIIDRNAARLGMIAEHERLKMARAEVARDIISDIKKLVHNNMIHAVSKDEYSYINIKVLDAILQNYLNNLK